LRPNHPRSSKVGNPAVSAQKLVTYSSLPLAWPEQCHPLGFV
jgi:hypothetical protein